LKTNLKLNSIAIAVFIFAISLIFGSCSYNDNEVFGADDTIINKAFGIDDTIINEVIYFQLIEEGESNPSLNLNVEITYNTEIDNIISFTATEDLLNVLNIESNEELLYLIESSISSETNSDDPGDDSPHTKCIQYCIDKYSDEDGNKTKGRGRCKGNCWIDTIVRVIREIGPKIELG